jgi:hypothetical protein
MLKMMLILSVSILLMGCAQFKKPSPIQISVGLLQSCPLVEYRSNNDYSESVMYVDYLINLYTDCAVSLDKLIEAVKLYGPPQ